MLHTCITYETAEALRKAQPADVHAHLMKQMAATPTMQESAAHVLVNSEVGSVRLHGFRLILPSGEQIDKGYACVKHMEEGCKTNTTRGMVGNREMKRQLLKHWGFGSEPRKLQCRIESISISYNNHGIKIPYAELPYDDATNARHDYHAVRAVGLEKGLGAQRRWQRREDFRHAQKPASAALEV